MTTAEVDAAVALGAKTVRQVRKATGAGTACGTCVKRLSCLLAAARVADSAPQESMPAAERLPAAVPADVVAASVAEPAFVHQAGCPAAIPAIG